MEKCAQDREFIKLVSFQKQDNVIKILQIHVITETDTHYCPKSGNIHKTEGGQIIPQHYDSLMISMKFLEILGAKEN